jgi:hypothetical protein
MAERKTRTKYQMLQAAAKNHCKNGSAASSKRLKAAEKRYKDDAAKKGKSSKEINAVISRVKKCPAKVSGTKKRTTKRKKK